MDFHFKEHETIFVSPAEVARLRGACAARSLINADLLLEKGSPISFDGVPQATAVGLLTAIDECLPSDALSRLRDAIRQEYVMDDPRSEADAPEGSPSA